MVDDRRSHTDTVFSVVALRACCAVFSIDTGCSGFAVQAIGPVFSIDAVRTRCAVFSVDALRAHCAVFSVGTVESVISVGAIEPVFPIDALRAVFSVETVGSVFSIDAHCAVFSIDALRAVISVGAIEPVFSIDSLRAVFSVETVGSVFSIDAHCAVFSIETVGSVFSIDALRAVFSIDAHCAHCAVFSVQAVGSHCSVISVETVGSVFSVQAVGSHCAVFSVQAVDAVIPIETVGSVFSVDARCAVFPGRAHEARGVADPLSRFADDRFARKGQFPIGGCVQLRYCGWDAQEVGILSGGCDHSQIRQRHKAGVGGDLGDLSIAECGVCLIVTNPGLAGPADHLVRVAVQAHQGVVVHELLARPPASVIHRHVAHITAEQRQGVVVAILEPLVRKGLGEFNIRDKFVGLLAVQLCRVQCVVGQS